METRKHTIVDTRNMYKKVIESTATTFGELKRELAAAGISTTNMAVQESITKTEFINDSSLIPTNVPFKGVTTNNLIFRITTAQKYTESGKEAFDRKAIYTVIKQNNLEELIKNKFNKNYTQVSSKDLVDFFEELDNQSECSNNNQEQSTNNVKKALNLLIDILLENEYISELDAASITATLEDDGEYEKNAVYSDDDINAVIDF